MGKGKVPPPKKHYSDPADEKRSRKTQAAADQFLTGGKRFADEANEIDRKRGR